MPLYGGFPILGVPFGGPYNQDYKFWVLYWGPPILGNYHIPKRFFTRMLPGLQATQKFWKSSGAEVYSRK